MREPFSMWKGALENNIDQRKDRSQCDKCGQHIIAVGHSEAEADAIRIRSYIYNCIYICI